MGYAFMYITGRIMITSESDSEKDILTIKRMLEIKMSNSKAIISNTGIKRHSEFTCGSNVNMPTIRCSSMQGSSKHVYVSYRNNFFTYHLAMCHLQSQKGDQSCGIKPVMSHYTCRCHCY